MTKKSKYQFFIKEKETGKITSFIVQDEVLRIGDKSCCDLCDLRKYCFPNVSTESNKLEVYIKIYDKKHKDMIPHFVSGTDCFCSFYLTSYEYSEDYFWTKIMDVEVSNKIILTKTMDVIYGDETEEEISFVDETGYAFITPYEIISDFCKKICPGYKDDMSCMKDLGCPFHKQMNTWYKIL